MPVRRSSGLFRSISQIGVNAGFASLNDGFPPLTMTPIAAGGVPPFGQDMNGILNQITEIQQWEQAGGGWQFDVNFAAEIGGYPQGAILNSKVVLGRKWMSIVDNNLTDPDSASAANWVTPAGQLPVGTPVPSFSPTVPPGFVAANALRIGNTNSGANITISGLFAAFPLCLADVLKFAVPAQQPARAGSLRAAQIPMRIGTPTLTSLFRTCAEPALLARMAWETELPDS